MGIDKDKFQSAAMRGDVSGIAINTVLALITVRDVLVKLQRPDISAEIVKLTDLIQKLEAQYDDLVGWTDE